MIFKEQTRFTKKQLGIIITASVLAFLIIFYIALSAILGAIGSGQGGEEAPLPEIFEGEALYGKNPIAYPTFSESDVQSFSVSYFGKEGYRKNLTMMRPKKDEPFIIYYSDENGDARVYQPPICSAEKNFDYKSLYAVEGSDGLNVYKITYLFAAVSAMYFNNRIELSNNQNERAVQLNRYGLSDSKKQAMAFTYLDSEGKEVSHTVYVGDKLLTEAGYYFMVDDRNYVYTSTGGYLHYAFGGVESFIESRVIAEGLTQDNAYEPYLTTDYKQWKNKIFTSTTDTVSQKSKVIAEADILTPQYFDGILTGGDGYERLGYSEMTFDLKSLGKQGTFGNIITALSGKNIGSYENREIVATVVADTNEAYEGLHYTYTINTIEAAFNDGEDMSVPGESVKGYDYIKVTYSYKLSNGTATETYLNAHAVIDMKNRSAVIPDSVYDVLENGKIGVLDTYQTFEVDYDATNAKSSEVEYVITEIVMIYQMDNGTVNYGTEVKDDSVVSYRYVYKIDGETLGGEMSNLVDLSEIDSEDGDNYTIKQALLGKKVENHLDLSVLKHTMLCQAMMNFTTYSIKSINYFVEEEAVSSFKFVNYSERDPFYGESLYINTLENKYKSYALNATACERVVRFLGGINEDSSSSKSIGLVGSETVAVGLTPANMLKYGKTGIGLYANTIYFELPRGIEVISSGGENSYDDYRHLDTLGFYLYISDEMPDGTRYVGSDMYDIIVKIDARGFEFLEKTFVDYWARRSIASVSYSDIEDMTLDFFMDDIYGSYAFDLEHRESWIVDGEATYEKPASGGTPYDMMVVHTALRSTEASETLLSKLLSESGKTSIRLSTVYTEAAGADEVVMDKYDTLGTSSFKSMLQLIYSTYYTGILSEDEQKDARADGELLMRFSFKVPGSSAYPYVYEFYRIDDRRVMVSVYRLGTDGVHINEVSDFFISIFAFKKMVRNFVNLLNGAEINVDSGYGD